MGGPALDKRLLVKRDLRTLLREPEEQQASERSPGGREVTCRPGLEAPAATPGLEQASGKDSRRLSLFTACPPVNNTKTFLVIFRQSFFVTAAREERNNHILFQLIFMC